MERGPEELQIMMAPGSITKGLCITGMHTWQRMHRQVCIPVMRSLLKKHQIVSISPFFQEAIEIALL